MARFGLLGACLTLFVGVALTGIPPARAGAPEPRITKCVRIFGYTVVQWDQAWVDEHYGKGSAVTHVEFSWGPFFPGHTAEGEILGRSAEAETPFQAENVEAILDFNGKEGVGDSFLTDSFNCSLVGNSHHLNRGRHLAKGRQR